jgi:aspartate kinase
LKISSVLQTNVCGWRKNPVGFSPQKLEGHTMIVMKFGGASVATPESFLKIAEIIIDRAKSGSSVAVVVSAMGNTTDQLLALGRQVNPAPPKRELDMLVSAGERISIALLAMALSLKGADAISFTGSQSGIITDENHSDALIIDVRPHRLLKAFEKGQIAITAGFQGVSRKGEITTLGRGGSDTTAVALAAALGASEVEFYKDVAGLYTADPKKSPSAHLLQSASFEKALELSERGAKVLHKRSVALARQNGIKLVLRSFDTPSVIGTIIGSESRSKTIYYETESCSC